MTKMRTKSIVEDNNDQQLFRGNQCQINPFFYFLRFLINEKLKQNSKYIKIINVKLIRKLFIWNILLIISLLKMFSVLSNYEKVWIEKAYYWEMYSDFAAENRDCKGNFIDKSFKNKTFYKLKVQ